MKEKEEKRICFICLEIFTPPQDIEYIEYKEGSVCPKCFQDIYYSRMAF